MVKVVQTLVFVCFSGVLCVPPSPTSAVTDIFRGELSTMKNTIKVLSDQWEKWNNLFLTSLEPRITSTASTLASIDSNIHNLQERAHVWDTFQLHVSAWNEQLASLDRKIDIISKGQEKVLNLDAKINAILGMEYKLDNSIKILNNIYDSVNNLDTTVHSKKQHDVLLNEFATRGVLSSIKLVEKKLDRLLINSQSNLLKIKGTDEKPKFSIKCNTPRIFEELLNDISSKVDVIFDNISNAKDEIDDSDYDSDYLDASMEEGSGINPNAKNQTKNRRLKKAVKKISLACKQANQAVEEILNRAIRIENTSLVILDKENTHFEKLSKTYSENKCFDGISKYSENLTNNLNLILESYFSEQRAHFETISNKLAKKSCRSNFKPESRNYNLNLPLYQPTKNTLTETLNSIDTEVTTEESTFTDDIFEGTAPSSTLFYINEELANDNVSTQLFHDFVEAHEPQPTWMPVINQNKSSCEDLDKDDSSGVYIFSNSFEKRTSELFFNKRYCEIRNDGLWTVVQRRDNYRIQHNFNVSWDNYKYGFGNLHKDFWMGNNFLYVLSSSSYLVLRIELEDFENRTVWAEYDNFKVSSEEDNYRLSIGRFSGNASDSLTSHNCSFFSTYDRKNDNSPECCPCAVSYGGGWWFNRCFESNLNGVYHRKPNENNYFRGIIWEHWLGNYSLKKSVMMVKSRKHAYTDNYPESTGSMPYYEDP